MLDYWISKTMLYKKLENFAGRYLAGRVKANQLTILGFGIGLISAFLIYLGNTLDWDTWGNLIAAIFMIISFALDLFDGSIARVTEPTIFGGILDIFCDRCVELSILLSIASTDPTNNSWPTLFSLGAIILCITVFLLSGSVIKNEKIRESKKVIYYTKGIMERGETFLFLFVMTIFPVVRSFLMWIFALLVYVTAIQRLWITRNISSELEKNIEK